ncbi:hypothetical protein [Marmoricola sp. RAF53]|uniref:hypothetical protein n=1 Tax=Marmoricola sp. RAF53 TaxID=3233059 RepID=UPI003F9A979B
MTPVLGAGLAVLGAGIAYRLGGRTHERLSVRIVGALLMFVGGYLAVPLFGSEDSASSFMKMAAALWVPQFLLGVWHVSPRTAAEEK